MYWFLSFVIGLTVLIILAQISEDISQKEDTLSTCISIFLAIFCSTLFGAGLIVLWRHAMTLVG